ncbi:MULTISPECIES: hypothetical protein [Streptomyces]|uniref:Uncharacterized protein n=1 Tax=Streptomyces fradiae ATCC 10745 = DSM 40063 TaxID=1319510 RepID=A0A1Y2NNY0_STRFR|nr:MULTISPECIES: hypothetical protein [Streptomyces]KAF0646581.1 hypothetical protein K701_27925 [Streptomyces fradiae ATCC 10745 = DSM 40063]OSY49202.1 hypothetical protein BG846_05180 [Streptomyces fradiae ATCC 10745 = DSM 40063]
MTTMTIAPATTGPDDTSEYAAGRADAYDDAHTLTLPQLHTRAAHYIAYATPARAAGYADRVHETAMERAAVTAAETELAHTSPTTWARTNDAAA